jgi:hypothetical protein
MSEAPAVIVSKFANALVPGAEPTARASRMSGLGGSFVFDWVRRSYGGLWVGGSMELTPRDLTFTPNAMNRALHTAVASRTVPLGRVVAVKDRFGVLTRIIDVTVDDGSVFTFRCFGAPAFARQIAAAAAAARKVGR